MYRQQFLDYLSRYDKYHDVPIAPTPQPRRSLGVEWYRKEQPTLQSQSSDLSLHEMSEEGLSARQEGESYLSTPIVRGGESFNLLAWWRVNEVTYPRLAQVARDILPIQIATVGVERVFNVAKDVIGDRRHRLHAKTIRDIMFLRDSYTRDENRELIDEDSDPNDLVTDLFELPGQVETTESRDEDFVHISSADEQEGEKDTVEIVEPPRKRRNVRIPSRYRD